MRDRIHMRGSRLAYPCPDQSEIILGLQMPTETWHHYRFYALTHEGHVAGPSSSCRLPNDAAAVKHAKLIIEDDAIEVWEGARVVAHIAPDDT